MKVIISQSAERNQFGSSIVYVESPLDSVVDQWFDKHGVYSLPFKCKTWNKVKSLATKVNIKVLKELFPEALNIRFSRTAGCRCGCSQGYIIKHEPNQRGRNFWVNVQAEPEEVKEFSEEVFDEKYVVALEKEKN